MHNRFYPINSCLPGLRVRFSFEFWIWSTVTVLVIFTAALVFSHNPEMDDLHRRP